MVGREKKGRGRREKKKMESGLGEKEKKGRREIGVKN